jgi:hypothetical protein
MPTDTSSAHLRRIFYRYISRYEVLLRDLPKDDVEVILSRSIGSRNMSKLVKMIKFLELERGSSVSDKFTRNILLLSILYGASRGTKRLAFADLVFQALYVTLSDDSKGR